MKPNKQTAKLLKGHRIDFVEQSVLDLIPNGEKSYALLAPLQPGNPIAIRHFILSKGYGENEIFGSVEEMVMHCVDEKIINETKGKSLITKYFKNPQATDQFLDKKLVDELKDVAIDFSKYYILETAKPANAVISTKVRNVFLAPYYFVDAFVAVHRDRTSKFMSIENMMKAAVFSDVLTKKQAKAITDYYYYTKETN